MAFLPRTSGVKQRFQAVAKTDWQKTPQGKAAMREAIIAEADYVFVGKGMNFSPETVAAYERRPPMTNRVLLLFGDGHVEETDKADPRYTALQK
jgi:prepilin-type processing-associated H-X9-DG protein